MTRKVEFDDDVLVGALRRPDVRRAFDRDSLLADWAKLRAAASGEGLPDVGDFDLGLFEDDPVLLWRLEGAPEFEDVPEWGVVREGSPAIFGGGGVVLQVSDEGVTGVHVPAAVLGRVRGLALEWGERFISIPLVEGRSGSWAAARPAVVGAMRPSSAAESREAGESGPPATAQDGPLVRLPPDVVRRLKRLDEA